MKTSTIILVGSLALNAVIGVAMWMDDTDDDEPALTAALTEPVPDKSTAPDPETWHALQGGPLAEQRDRLQAAGLPPQIVRAILTAQVREVFAARRKALNDAQGDIPFWKNPTRDPNTTAAQRELNRQEQKMLRDLLGRDPRQDDPAYAAYTQRQFGDLPEEKVEQLRRIMDDYNDRRAELAGIARGPMLPDERKRFQALDREMHDEFATVLTPQELFEYDLRSSNVAMQVRSNLTAFDVTEQEYIGLFKLQQAFDEKFGLQAGPLTPDQLQARQVAQRQLNDDIKAMLGPGRYAEYERATDYSYRQASQLVARLDLPPQTATTVYEIQKDAVASAGRIRSDRSLSPDNRNAQLEALVTDTTGKLSSTLGTAGFEAYRQNGLGGWMSNLRPPPASGPGVVPAIRQ